MRSYTTVALLLAFTGCSKEFFMGSPEQKAAAERKQNLEYPCVQQVQEARRAITEMQASPLAVEEDTSILSCNITSPRGGTWARTWKVTTTPASDLIVETRVEGEPVVWKGARRGSSFVIAREFSDGTHGDAYLLEANGSTLKGRYLYNEGSDMTCRDLEVLCTGY